MPAGEQRQNAIADAIVRNAGEKLERMPAKQVCCCNLPLALDLSGQHF